MAVVDEIEAASGSAWHKSADLEDAASIESLAEACLERYGFVDVVVHNAGYSSRVRSARFISEEEWSGVYAVNVTGPMLLNQSLLPSMLEAGKGTVILVSSMAALRPGVMAGSAYSAAKGAARNYMTCLASEVRQQGIRCTTVFPGEVDTPILANRPLPPGAEERATMMQPEDIAEAIVLAATLPGRTVIEEISLMPTRLRDYSADIKAARAKRQP